MSNAVGLRDTLIRLYAMDDSGTDGFTRKRYSFVSQWWGRVDESHVAARAAQERLQMKVDAIAEFADEAVLPTNGVLKDTSTGQCWWIRGFNSIRQLRRIVAGLERVAEEVYVTTVAVQGASMLDGVHLVDPVGS